MYNIYIYKKNQLVQKNVSYKFNEEKIETPGFWTMELEKVLKSSTWEIESLKVSLGPIHYLA